MLKRIITAAVCLALLIPTLVFSDTWIFFGVIMLLALIAIFELCGCIGIRKKIFLSIPAYLITGAAFILTYFYKDTALFLPIMCFAVLSFMFIVFTASMLSTGNVRFSQAAELISFTAYIIAGFLAVLLLRHFGNVGKYLYLLVFIGAWSTDTGAYFAGVSLGKHKLIPEVSPHKTVEGAIGGIVGCIVGFSVYGSILSLTGQACVNFVSLIILACVTAVVSQLGDLIASYVKREAEIKDYGFIFPGHGGVLDRFDSVIAVAPLIFAASYITYHFGVLEIFTI